MSRFEKEHDRISGIIRLTYEQKSDKCLTILHFFDRLCIMADIAENIREIERVEIPYYVCSLTLRSYLEMQACLLEGAYHSAGRSLRWLFEENVIGATACAEPSLLDQKYGSAGCLDLGEFEKLLEHCDETGRMPGSKKEIFKYFSLPPDDLLSLFYDLCKYVHLSRTSFDRKLDWPNLQYIPEKFDEIFKHLIKTVDLVFFMQSRMCLCFNGGTAGALKNSLKDHVDLNALLPNTVTLISNLK